MKILTLIICFVFLMSISNCLKSAAYVNKINCNEKINLSKNIFTAEDQNGNASLEDIIKINQFKKSNKTILNFGVSNSAFWIKFLIKKNCSKNILINIDQPLLNNVEFYYKPLNSKKLITNKISNETFNSRRYKYLPYLFEIQSNPDEVLECYIRIKGNSQLVVPIQLGDFDLIIEELIIKEVLFGFYGGFLIALLFYNIFIYFTVKDLSYLYYVFYILTICLTQLTLCGFTFKYLWPNSFWITTHAVDFLSSLVGISAILFIKVFLQVPKYFPKATQILNFFVLIFIITILLSFLDLHKISFQIMQINTLVASIFSLFISIKILNLGYRPAKYFLFAWSVLLIGAIAFVLKDFDLLPFNDFTEYTLHYASGIEVILLSFALGDRINILEKEKQESRAQAILVLEENEKIIREQNVMLETKVKERTQELELANDEIHRTLKNLKDAQAQLVHAEKMASLGQLTAGIAHEINNPINFVTSSINPLKRDLDFISQIISSAESFLNEDDKQKRLQDMKTLLDDMDYSYLLEEINMLLNGILEGSTRTSEIVKSLRNFSRLDETDFKKANIIEGLESTLLLLNSSLSDAKIQVKKRFLATPIITCQPGKLNQVYMNIINNAIYATKARKDLSIPGTIDISVTEENELILINIKDNGIGMSQKTKEKLFEPFFTTKDVGEGTGLGLSIVYNIIEGHKGKIEVDSEEGVGTVFSITLPANL